MDLLQQLLGGGADSLQWYQAMLRAVIVYFSAIIMVRIGKKRFLGKNTAFDVVLGVILGSVVSRAITNADPILPILLAAFVLVGIHLLLALMTFKFDRLGSLFKGNKSQLVNRGEILWDAMAKSYLSRKDLMEQVRSEGRTEDLKSVEKAYLERSGSISIIPSKREFRVLEVKVEDGVQTVRIAIES